MINEVMYASVIKLTMQIDIGEFWR